MMYFSTLFDSNYISKGLALYLSIERYTQDFIMYVMAMDRKCQQMLSEMGLTKIVVDCIDDINDPKLTEAKNNRSRAEYCWTCGPYITDFFLHKYNLPNITYLDSDLMFFSSPQVVLEELDSKNASVGLAPHFTKYPIFGKYCVQLVYFKNNNAGRTCLRWWRDRCLEWCYSKVENGKYGDQKYLDYFGEMFENVYEIENRGVGIAAWNMNYYQYDDNFVYYDNKKWPIVFFHYSNIRVFLQDGTLYFKHTIFLNKAVRKYFIEPYAALMKNVHEQYLGESVKSIIVTPLDKKNYFFKPTLYFINKIVPLEGIIAFFLKRKYKERKSPYSEK